MDLRLHAGQVRAGERLVQNGVWFNLQWQMIGWGDLIEADFVAIAKTLPFGDLFIVVPTMVAGEPFTATYGIEHCSWLIEHGSIYDVSDNPFERVKTWHGLRYREINRATVSRIIDRISRVSSRINSQ